jgi:hypothetical protein
MTSLLRRAATCVGIAMTGISGLSEAQSTAVVMPSRTELRRPLTVAGEPIVQQSPNGLYQMMITDTGIVLRGPEGAVTINATGIHIGEARTARVSIDAADMGVRIGRDVMLQAGRNMDIRGDGNVGVRAIANMTITAAAGTFLSGSRVTLGCTNSAGKPAARLGDQVNTSASPPAILQGSQTVLIC